MWLTQWAHTQEYQKFLTKDKGIIEGGVSALEGHTWFPTRERGQMGIRDKQSPRPFCMTRLIVINDVNATHTASGVLYDPAHLKKLVQSGGNSPTGAGFVSGAVNAVW